ncbi:MAG: hypothetical protein ACE5JH_05480 [Acidobacteriota bacterium]
MRFKAIGLAGLALLFAAAACPATARAASFDFLFSVSRVSNDEQYFLNLTVSSYGYDRAVIEPILPRLRAVEEDLPVALFLARKSGRSVDFVVGLRARGMSWSAIFGHVGVPFDVLFLGIDRDPGPPYGKAWGHWRKKGRRARLSDAAIVGLVQVQIGSRWAGLSTLEMARARGKGKRVSTLVADRKGRPHKGRAVAPAAKGGAKRKREHAAGKDKPKGRRP